MGRTVLDALNELKEEKRNEEIEKGNVDLRFEIEGQAYRVLAEKAWRVCQELLELKLPITRENLLRELDDEDINTLQELKVFGRDHPDTGVIFVNWSSNRYYPNATLAYYKNYNLIFKEEYAKVLGAMARKIDDLAADVELDWKTVYSLLQKVVGDWELNSKAYSAYLIDVVNSLRKEIDNLSIKYNTSCTNIVEDIWDYVRQFAD